ncbi:MAG: methylenetetrahydrofolate reductase C-terminal domain-containing protein, partial [Candidatus Hodarchaeota archaeon]
ELNEMIITKQKLIQQILDYIGPYKRILLSGCDGCHQPPRSEKEAEILGDLIKLKNKVEGSIDGLETKAITILRQCDDKIVVDAMKPIINEYQPEAIISMACGIGVQMLAEIFSELPVFPGQDTMFYGGELHDLNNYKELCRACGDCLLGYTGGICPVTNCAKSLSNGPCGGTIGGKCEVGNYTENCAWMDIYEKLKQFGRLDLFRAFRPPRDYRLRTPPRKILVKETLVGGSEENEDEKEVA